MENLKPVLLYQLLVNISFLGCVGSDIKIIKRRVEYLIKYTGRKVRNNGKTPAKVTNPKKIVTEKGKLSVELALLLMISSFVETTKNLSLFILSVSEISKKNIM